MSKRSSVLRIRVGLQLLAPDQHDGDDDELHHAAEHGEQGGTRLVGVPEGGEGEVLGQLGEHDTEEHTRERPEIEDNLVEGGKGIPVGQGHIDVLEVGEGHVMSHAAEVLGQADEQDQGDIQGDGHGQRADRDGEVPRPDEAVDDL